MGERTVDIAAGDVTLTGDLLVPDGASGIVVFAHGSGSSRHSPRNRAVAEALRGDGLATLLMDLLTEDEEREDRVTAHLRFDIGLLAERLQAAIEDLVVGPKAKGLRVGVFGASTGAAAALVAAARLPNLVHAVVSRGGRPDLAGEVLPEGRAPTLLVVRRHDEPGLPLNREALGPMR